MLTNSGSFSGTRFAYRPMAIVCHFPDDAEPARSARHGSVLTLTGVTFSGDTGYWEPLAKLAQQLLGGGVRVVSAFQNVTLSRSSDIPLVWIVHDAPSSVDRTIAPASPTVAVRSGTWCTSARTSSSTRPSRSSVSAARGTSRSPTSPALRYRLMKPTPGAISKEELRARAARVMDSGLPAPITILAVVAAIFTVNWKLSLIVLVAMPVYAGAFLSLNPRLRKSGRDARREAEVDRTLDALLRDLCVRAPPCDEEERRAEERADHACEVLHPGVERGEADDPVARHRAHQLVEDGEVEARICWNSQWDVWFACQSDGKQ